MHARRILLQSKCIVIFRPFSYQLVLVSISQNACSNVSAGPQMFGRRAATNNSATLLPVSSTSGGQNRRAGPKRADTSTRHDTSAKNPVIKVLRGEFARFACMRSKLRGGVERRVRRPTKGGFRAWSGADCHCAPPGVARCELAR